MYFCKHFLLFGLGTDKTFINLVYFFVLVDFISLNNKLLSTFENFSFQLGIVFELKLQPKIGLVVTIKPVISVIDSHKSPVPQSDCSDPNVNVNFVYSSTTKVFLQACRKFV